jgi:hypothetical protein
VAAFAERIAALIFYRVASLWAAKGLFQGTFDRDELHRMVKTRERKAVFRQNDDCR